MVTRLLWANVEMGAQRQRWILLPCASYNYASGRLDHQTYFKSIRIDQSRIETIVLDRILAAWFDEAVLVDGLLPPWRLTGC